MITTLLLLVSVAQADVCKYQNVDFDFALLENRNRAVVLKSGEKIAFPEGGLAVNLIQAAGEGSVCKNSGVYPLGAGRVAVLFERLDSSITNTYAVVFNVAKKAFEFEPVVLAPNLELQVKKTEKGFSFVDFQSPTGGVEALAPGVGPAAGLDMVLQQKDLWKTVELGPKGLAVKLDKDLTWRNTRWKKYFAKQADFEKALRVGGDPLKTHLYFAFSREKKKDCIMIDHAGDKKAYCAAISAANLSDPGPADDPEKE